MKAVTLTLFLETLAYALGKNLVRPKVLFMLRKERQHLPLFTVFSMFFIRCHGCPTGLEKIRNAFGVDRAAFLFRMSGRFRDNRRRSVSSDVIVL